MQINKRMHFVVPMYGEDGKTIAAYAHSTPLPSEVVDVNFMLLAQTFSSIFNQGLGEAAGPAVAARLLRQIATNTGIWEDEKKQPLRGQVLMEEIRRLTNIIVPGEPGQPWRQLPLQTAVDLGSISPEDKSEVENAVVFFIVVSATLPRAQRKSMLEGAAELWSAQLSFSNSTEWAASLKTSTGTGNSGGRSPAPAKPDAAPANATVDGRPASVPR